MNRPASVYQTLTGLGLLLLFCGCQSSSPQTVEQLLSQPVYVSSCVRKEQLPSCPPNRVRVIEYGHGRCVAGSACI